MENTRYVQSEALFQQIMEDVTDGFENRLLGA